MKQLFLTLLCLTSLTAWPQEVKTSYQDDQLRFELISEQIATEGTLEFCISDGVGCISNLQVGFTVRIYNAEGDLIWNSIWSGRNTAVRFRKLLPEAHRVVIEAEAPFVVNTVTTERIQTKETLKLEFNIER